MKAVFVVGGLDVFVQASGECRFFMHSIDRVSGVKSPLGVARWEPDDDLFDLVLVGGDALIPDGSALMNTLVTRLDAVRSWYKDSEKPDPHLGILLGDNTASH